MANFQSDYARGLRPMPTPQGSELVSVRMTVAVPATLAANDVLEFGELPVDCVPVDFILDSTDIDTGTSTTISVGIANAAKTALDTSASNGGAVWLATSNIGQAGGMARPTTRACVSSAPRQPDPASGSASGAQLRMLAGFMAAVGTSAAGTVGLTIMYRAAHYGA